MLSTASVTGVLGSKDPQNECPTCSKTSLLKCNDCQGKGLDPDQIKKNFFRAANTLKQFWNKYREKVFDRDIVAVGRFQDGHLQLIEKDKRETESPYDDLYPFPSKLALDITEKMRILNFMACTDVVVYLTPTVKTLFTG
jgi:hypothetical protein